MSGTTDSSESSSVPLTIAYEKPLLERLGSFRELTESEGLGLIDGLDRHHDLGCKMIDSSTIKCHPPR